MTSEDFTKVIKDELLSALPDLSQEKAQLDRFLETIQPEIDQAIGTGDLMSLDFLRDRLIGRTARASLGLINRERLKVITIVTTTIRVLVRVGLGTL